MFSRILIISDNPRLSKEFELILTNMSSFEGSYGLGISPFSDKDDFKNLVANKIEILDFKNDGDINYVINNYDLIFSIHCKQIFPEKIINNIKCINIHPGYNPINRGWYPQVFAIIEDLPIGATIHEMDNELDHGKIIVREFVPKYVWDTSYDVYTRVLDKEIELLGLNLENIINNNYKTIEPESEGSIFLKSDFKKLLKVDLEKQGSYKNFIDHIRALSHGDYKNAYFVDPETGKKVYLSLNLEVENG